MIRYRKPSFQIVKFSEGTILEKNETWESRGVERTLVELSLEQFISKRKIRKDLEGGSRRMCVAK